MCSNYPDGPPVLQLWQNCISVQVTFASKLVAMGKGKGETLLDGGETSPDNYGPAVSSPHFWQG